MPSYPISRGVALVTLASAAMISARAVDKRSYSFNAVCDASRQPDWDGCQSAFDQINAHANNDPNYQWTFQPGVTNCVVYYGNNCAVSICGLHNYNPVPQYLVVDATDTLITDCKYNGAGGNSLDSDGSMSVSAYATDQNPVKVKRDSTWTEVYRIDNAAPEQYRQQVLSALPGGSSWSLTTEQSQTNRVEASVSLSESFFTIFSSSQSITYGYDKTVTTSSTQTINNNCANDQTGTLFWYPLFTQHHGGFSDGGPSPIDIYVPLTEGDTAVGKYQVVCSG